MRPVLARVAIMSNGLARQRDILSGSWGFGGRHTPNSEPFADSILATAGFADIFRQSRKFNDVQACGQAAMEPAEHDEP